MTFKFKKAIWDLYQTYWAFIVCNSNRLALEYRKETNGKLSKDDKLEYQYNLNCADAYRTEYLAVQKVLEKLFDCKITLKQESVSVGGEIVFTYNDRFTKSVYEVYS